MKVSEKELMEACETAFTNSCQDTDDLVCYGASLLKAIITGKHGLVQEMIDDATAILKKDIHLEF